MATDGAMHLVQILLPLADNGGQEFPKEMFRDVQRELTDRFGGLTAFTRAPAEGRWAEGGGAPCHDDIVIFEVMAEELDRAWWQGYRAGLERRFRQESILIRALPASRL